MKNIGIFLFTVFALVIVTSCETEAEKQARIRQQEADKIVLSEEEFATLKKYESSRPSYGGTIEIEESRVIPDDKINGNEACKTLSLDDLLELYNTGKKRDLLVGHGFEVNYYVYMMQNKDMDYEEISNSHFIGYGRCYFNNSVHERRVGLRLTHVKHQQVDYETTFKDNFDQIEAALIAKGAELKDERGQYKLFEYDSIPIELDVKNGRGDRPNIYKVKFKSTYEYNPMDSMTPKEREEIKKFLEQNQNN